MTLNRRSFLGFHMAGQCGCISEVVKEGTKTPGSVADSSGCQIPPNPGADIGPWKKNSK